MASSSDNDNEECHPFQLIDGDGKFNDGQLDDFVEKVNLGEYGVSYVVAAIVGPQSSGKSTLLNHLFGTNFKAMNAADGKQQITQGIWMANCPGIDPPTLIMDVEGNDGQERGQDDTTFERQTALFALVVSNIVIVNMWYSDVGREQGANKPLLRTVFQAMVTMFTTNKVTLMFVIRDVNPEAQFSSLEAQVKKAIQEIWEQIAPKKAQLTDFFNVQVVALPFFQFQKELFVEEVGNLRKRFFNSMSPGGLASGKQSLIPASGFSCSAMSLWETIRGNKDLDIPSHKVLVATMFCEKIVDEKFTWFSENEDWLKVKKSVQDGNIDGFGDKIDSLLNTCLVEYHERTKLYDDQVRKTKQTVLKTRLLQVIQPVWTSVIDLIETTTLDMFKKELDEAVKNGGDPSKASRVFSDSLNIRFDKECADAEIQLAKWDVSNVKAKLLSHHVLDHVTLVTNKVAQRKAEEVEAKRKLEHEKELAANREADKLVAEREVAERQRAHELEIITIQAAAKETAELEKKQELIVGQLTSENDAIKQASKHQLEVAVKDAALTKVELDHKFELAELNAKNDAAELKRVHETEIAEMKRNQERERERNELDKERNKKGWLGTFFS